MQIFNITSDHSKLTFSDMFLLTFSEYLSPAATIVFFQNRLGMALTCLVVATLLLWRLCKFVILPLIYPNDPKELPYWIPVLGHGVAFFNNSNHLLDYAKNYFGNTREPFAITAAGSKLYILTNAKDVSAAYKNTSTLSFESFVQAMMRTSGSSEDVILKMYKPMDPKKANFPNPQNKPLAKLARELHIYQLFPGKNLDSLYANFVEYFKQSLNLKTMSQYRYTRISTDHDVVVPLYLWVSDVFVSAGQEAYFGPALAQVEPELTWAFLEFDDLTWQVLYQYPKFLASTMIRTKSKVIDGLERYFTLPTDKRPGASWFTPAMETEMRNLGFGTHDVAVMMMTIYWGINTNTRRACFWMITYMIFEPELFHIIREETRPAFQDGDLQSPDIRYLEEKCPRLNGIWDETVRLSAYSSSVRYVTEDTIIGGKILRQGNRVMIPNRQLHFDENVFGKKSRDFNSTRFIDNDGLIRSGSWRPFGGGSTICPGRFIAKQSAITFVTMILQRFDIEPAGEGKFPRLEEGNPVLGIMSTKGGDDLSVRLSSRDESI